MACPFLSQGVNGRRNGLGVQGWTWEILRAFFRLSNILIGQFKAFFKLILRELLPQMDCLNGSLDRGQDILKLEVKLRPGSIFHSTRRQNQWKQDYGSHVCPKIGELAQIQSNAWPCRIGNINKMRKKTLSTIKYSQTSHKHTSTYHNISTIYIKKILKNWSFQLQWTGSTCQGPSQVA